MTAKVHCHWTSLTVGEPSILFSEPQTVWNYKFEKPMSQLEIISLIVDRVAVIIEDADNARMGFEEDPFRNDLFQAFAFAFHCGFLMDLEPNLQADSLAQHLSERWNLKEVGQSAFQKNPKSNDPGVRRVQVLWSACRQWMAWSYAWVRYEEFHAAAMDAENELEQETKEQASQPDPPPA